VLVLRVPLGVVAVVSPMELAVHDGRRGLRPRPGAGNTVVWNPSSSTTACSALLAEVIAEAQLPPGVFNFVPGPGSDRRRTR
jgi:acyl-CoA reductase-like NAD-dependent aldehyde dehydrogenase